MTTQVFSEAELERLRGFPELDRDELIRFFTVTPSDEVFVKSHRGSANHLGVAVQLCALPWLGFVPDDVASAPVHAVQRLAEHLRIPADAISSYAARDQTRTDHLVEVAKLLAGAQLVRWSSRSWISSSPPGPWSMTRRRCCSAWVVNTCARLG